MGEFGCKRKPASGWSDKNGNSQNGGCPSPVPQLRAVQSEKSLQVPSTCMDGKCGKAWLQIAEVSGFVSPIITNVTASQVFDGHKSAERGRSEVRHVQF